MPPSDASDDPLLVVVVAAVAVGIAAVGLGASPQSPCRFPAPQLLGGIATPVVANLDS